MEFTDILQQFGVAYYTEGRNSRPGWIQLDCPWCGVSGKPGLGYKIDGGYCNCYKCGGHSAVSVLHELTKEPYDKLRKMLGGIAAGQQESKRHVGRLKMPRGLCELTKAHRRFLIKRGFDPEEVEHVWHIQALGAVASIRTSDTDKLIDLSWRIFIPVIWKGELVSWTTRTIQEDNPKRYISAPSSCETIPAKSILYGGDYCNHAACAIEGHLDVWRFGKGGAGLSGVGFTREQVRLLANYLIRGVWLDNEPEAQQRARKLVDELHAFPGDTTNFRSETGKDASRSSDAEVLQARTALGLSNVQ